MAEQVTLTRDSWKSAHLDGRYGRVFVITEEILTDAQGNVVKSRKDRRPIEPDADISGEPTVIQQMCNLVRTPEALARWAADKPQE